MDSYDITTPILAGYMAGGVSMLINHPLDSLKVLLQTESLKASKSTTAAPTTSTPSANVTTATNSTVVTRNLSTAVTEAPSQISKRSIRSLYAGLTGPLVSVGLVQSLNFALYDSIRRYLYYKQDQSHESNKDYLYKDPLYNVLTSSLATGVCITFVTSPVFVMKTKQQITGKSFSSTLKSTINHPNGLRNFYVGLGPHMICETLWRGCYFTLYEHLKRTVAQYDPALSQPLPLPHTMACAGVAGAFAWCIIFPIDVVRSRMYAQAAKFPNHPDPMSSLQMTKYLWKQGPGLKLFYRGIGINILRLTPMQMTLLPCYDLASQILANSSL